MNKETHGVDFADAGLPNWSFDHNSIKIMQRINSLAAIGAAMLMLAGCWSQQDLKTEIIEDSENFALDSRSNDSLRVSILIEYPVSGPKAEPLRKMQENLVAAIFGENHRSADPGQAISDFKTDISGQYRQDNLDILEYFSQMKESEGAENEDHSPMLSWESRIDGRFLPPHGTLCSYIIYEYNYTGGAHGIDNETAITFDMTSGEIISEEEIFINGFEEEMSKVLTAHLKDSFEAPEDYDMLFVKEIAPNGNFYVTDTGVTYLYGRYEIGAYAIGLTRVTVPWAEIVNLLK